MGCGNIKRLTSPRQTAPALPKIKLNGVSVDFHSFDCNTERTVLMREFKSCIATQKEALYSADYTERMSVMRDSAHAMRAT